MISLTQNEMIFTHSLSTYKYVIAIKTGLKYTKLLTVVIFLFFLSSFFHCIFFITIWSPYTPLLPTVTTLLSMSMSPFTILLHPSNP